MRTCFVETVGNGRDGGGPKHDPLNRREKTPLGAVRTGGVVGSFFSSCGGRRRDGVADVDDVCWRGMDQPRWCWNTERKEQSTGMNKWSWNT